MTKRIVRYAVAGLSEDQRGKLPCIWYRRPQGRWSIFVDDVLAIEWTPDGHLKRFETVDSIYVWVP